jgi:hypothetical protein
MSEWRDKVIDISAIKSIDVDVFFFKFATYQSSSYPVILSSLDGPHFRIIAHNIFSGGNAGNGNCYFRRSVWVCCGIYNKGYPIICEYSKHKYSESLTCIGYRNNKCWKILWLKKICGLLFPREHLHWTRLIKEEEYKRILMVNYCSKIKITITQIFRNYQKSK